MISVKSAVFSALAVVFAFAATAVSAAPRKIEGMVRERGTRNPLGGVNVFLLPAKLKATTDDAGRFWIEGEIPDEFSWVVNLAGYERLDQSDGLSDGLADSDLEPRRELFLEKSSYQTYETTVFGKGDKRDDTRKTLKAAQFNLPGSGGDPLKAVQNLPGVNRPAPFSSQVIIQGSAPRDTRYTIDGHEVPIIFHFGGLSSVVLPEALDRVEYLSAGYGPEYGRANGGVVGVFSREPRTDRLHGFAFVDTFNAGGMIETKVGEKGALLLGGRQSYVGAVLRKFIKKDSSFNLTVAPEFKDAVSLYTTELTPIDQLRVLAVASDDTLEFLLRQPVDQDPAFRGTFRNETAFFRLIPQWIHKHGDGVTSRWSLGLGRDFVRVDAADNYFYLKTWQVTVRGELEKRFSDTWTSQWGVDNRHTWSDVSLRLRDFYSQGGVANPFSTGDRRERTVSSTYDLVGLYWRNEILPAADSGWTLLPSLRGDYFSITREYFAEPRLGARYRIDDSFRLRASTGYYVQPAAEQETDASVGNPSIRSPKAVHASFGAEKDFRDGASTGWIWSGGPFYKQFYDQVVASTRFVNRGGTTVAENYNNSGSGRAFGLESMLKMELDPWTGWLSYTLARSTRWQDGIAEYPFSFDQTHVITAIGARKLGRNWQISGRLRYATGNPTTPVVGATYDADNDVYVPTRGGLYSDRLAPFFQFDVRIDKKWIYDRWILSAYLDIQNLTNRKNIEAIRYAYDYRSKSQVSGLPVLPTFGFKGEF